MKIEEIRASLEAKKLEIRGLLDAKDVAKAEIAMAEKRALDSTLAMEIEIEAEELRSLESQKNKEEKVVVNMGQANEIRAMVKQVMGMEMSVEERAMVKSADNAPVIPKQFINEIEKIQTGYGSLKEYCHVRTVTKNEGTFPFVDLEQNTLLEVVEGADILDGTLITTDLPYKCTKVGLNTALTSELLDDAEIEIEGLVKEGYSISVVKNQNAKIVNIIKTNAVAIATPTEYTDIETCMDTFVPAIRSGLVVLTNVTGFAYLKNKKDSTGRNLGLVTMVGDKSYFNGKELIVQDDVLVAPTVAGKKIFYVLNMKEAVKFMDRKAVTIERWRKQSNDTQNVSILARFAVVKGAVRSIKSIQF